MSREQQKQDHYVDLYDGPSSLQKRDGIPTLQERHINQQTLYEQEREQHLKTVNENAKTLLDAQKKLFNQTEI